MSFNTNQLSWKSLVDSAIASERAYIASLLGSYSTGVRVDIRVNEDDIYDDKLKKIFIAIKEIIRDGGSPDIVSVAQYLTNKGQFKPKGDIDNRYLGGITSEDFIISNFILYENALKNNSRKIKSQMLIEKIQEDTERSSSSLLKYGQEMVGLATNAMGSSAAMGFDIKKAHELYEDFAELEGKSLYGWSFGKEFGFLDSVTKGIRKGKTYRIGAPSNIGKTQLAYSIINNCLDQGAKVMFLTLENEIKTTLGFIMSNHQGVSIDSISSGKVTGDWEYLESIKDRLAIVEDCFFLGDIFSKVIEFQPDIVVLDYIGLMSIRGFTEEAKFAEYATQVQRFVKQTQVSWLDLSNLPNSLQATEELRLNPQFFGSTYLRNNTDVGIHMVLWKEFYNLKSEVENSNLNFDISHIHNRSGVNITVTKNRFGNCWGSRNYIIDFNKGAKFQEYGEAEFATLKSNFGY